MLPCHPFGVPSHSPMSSLLLRSHGVLLKASSSATCDFGLVSLVHTMQTAPSRSDTATQITI